MNVFHSMLKTKFFYVFCLLLLIQSCGGSEVSEVTRTNNNIEILSIESDVPLYEESDVSVTGSISAPDKKQLSYQWNQISGVPLTLRNTTQKTVMFTTPNLNINEEITLELTVKDANNNTQTKEEKLLLLYINTPPL